MDRRKIVEKLEQAEQENLNTKPKRAVVAVYWILRLIVIGVMVMTIIHKNYESTFVCVLVLILFMLPRFVERNFRIELPSTLEIIILVFIFAAEILGELKSYFITYPHWDSMLHTTTGFISAAFGFALGRSAQPQQAAAFQALAGVSGAGCVLLFHDGRRAVGVF